MQHVFRVRECREQTFALRHRKLFDWNDRRWRVEPFPPASLNLKFKEPVCDARRVVVRTSAWCRRRLRIFIFSFYSKFINAHTSLARRHWQMAIPRFVGMSIVSHIVHGDRVKVTSVHDKQRTNTHTRQQRWQQRCACHRPKPYAMRTKDRDFKKSLSLFGLE